MMEKRKAYEEKFDAQLHRWSAEIARLTAKAEETKADMKIEYYKMIENLQGKHDEARTKLHELRASGDDAWEDIKKGAESIWADVKNTFNHASARFK